MIGIEQTLAKEGVRRRGRGIMRGRARGNTTAWHSKQVPACGENKNINEQNLPVERIQWKKTNLNVQNEGKRRQKSMISNNTLFGGRHEHWPNRRRWAKEDNLQRWCFAINSSLYMQNGINHIYAEWYHIHSRQHMAVMKERSASMGSVAAILESARPRKGYLRLLFCCHKIVLWHNVQYFS